MKRIYLIMSLLCLSGILMAQTGVGWGQQRSKVNFKDSINIASGLMIGGVVQVPANWNTAYTDRLKWDGGATGLVAATGRTSLGATTVGSAFFTMTNPSAIRVPIIQADNSITNTEVTGTGNVVLSTSPVLTTPNIGTATGSITGNAATVTGFTPASGSLTLSGADAITLTTSGVTALSLPTAGMLETRNDVNTTVDSLVTNGVVGLSLPDSVGGATGNDYYMNTDQVKDYVAVNGGGLIGDKLPFIIGHTANAPAVGDSTITHGEFFGKILDVLRDGKFGYWNGDTVLNIREGFRKVDSTLTVNPPFQDNEQIEIRILEPISWNYLSLRGNESSLLTGLSVFYKMDEAAGVTTVDDANDVQDGKMWSYTTSGVSGKINYGKQINYGGEMTVTYNTNVSPKGTAFTIAGWIYLDSVPNTLSRPGSSPNILFNNVRLFSQKHTLSPLAYAHDLYIDGATADSNKVIFKTKNTSSTIYSVTSSVKLQRHQWYHIAAVNRGNGQTLQLYVNGVDVSASAGTFSGTVLEGLSTTYFGNLNFGYENALPGKLDEFGIWSKALSGAEITTLSAGSKTHPWE